MAERMHRGLLGAALLTGCYGIGAVLTGYLFDFGISLAVCGLLVIAAHMAAQFAEADRERLSRQRALVWERRERREHECDDWAATETQFSTWPFEVGAPE